MKSRQVFALYMGLSQFTTSPLSISSVSLGFTSGRFLLLSRAPLDVILTDTNFLRLSNRSS